MATLEHDVVTFFKQWLHHYMQTYISNSTNHYVVVGAGALEMQVQDPLLVNTLDVDMHIWTDYVNNEEKKHEIVENLAKSIELYFKQTIYPKNKGIIDTFINLSNNKFTKTNFTSSLWLKGAWLSNKVYTWRVKVFDYDLTDIVYQSHIPSEYFTVKEQDKNISYLTPKSFMNAQFKVFIDNMDKYFQFKGISYYSLTLDSKKEFWRYFAEKGYNYKSYSEYGNFQNFPKGDKDYNAIRINKTLARLKLVFETFDVSKDINKFSFKQAKTSCLMLSFVGNDLWTTQDNKYKCNMRTLFGGTEINYDLLKNFLSHTISSINISQYISALDQHLQRKPIHPQLLNSSYSWSEQSAPITQFLRTKYYHKLLNINATSYSETQMIHNIHNIQSLCSIKGPDYPITVFKTARMLYIKPKDTVKFKSSFDINDIIPLYEFHSTSIDPMFSNYMQFANFEIGCAGFIITIPKNSYIYYMGTDTKRTKYPLEYEVLLPYGCSLKIIKKNTNHYVGGENNIKYRMDIYEALYIDPPNKYFQQDMLQQDMLQNELGTNISMLSSSINAPNFIESDIPPTSEKFVANLIGTIKSYILTIDYRKIGYAAISKLLYGLAKAVIIVLSGIGWSFSHILDLIKWLFNKVGVIVSTVYGYNGVIIDKIKEMVTIGIQALILKIKTSMDIE